MRVFSLKCETQLRKWAKWQRFEREVDSKLEGGNVPSRNGPLVQPGSVLSQCIGKGARLRMSKWWLIIT